MNGRYGSMMLDRHTLGGTPGDSRSTAARTVSRWRPSWAAMVPIFHRSA